MYYEENKPNPALIQAKKAKKQKQATLLIALALIGGLAYYFFGYLPEERQRAKEEITEMFRDNWNVTVDKLDKNLWAAEESWEIYLESLFLPYQVKAFKEKMLKAIEQKVAELEQEELDKPRKMREEAVEEINKLLDDKEKELPKIQEFLEKFTEKINNSPFNDLSPVTSKAKSFIIEERTKRQGLHWRRKIYNWADRWLIRNTQSFENAWTKLTALFGKEPKNFGINGIYRIQFPPTLWNELTEEQQELAKSNGHGELILRDEVHDYKFSSLIEEWENKVKPNPVRGEMDPNDLSNLDNNALFYGAPRTGKSVMAEKLAYEADIYPLVVVQGSTLTPTKVDNDAEVNVLIKFIYTISDINHNLVDNYGFERQEEGEVRYILFLDEADQICTTNLLPPKDASSQLTFLKECMGSDNKSEESKNLWIAATNHLDSINIAVYQAGRLSNPLSFSWTLGEFINYSDDASISSQFPTHWTEAKTLNDEDNKWVNRFNKIIFDKDFLPFWNIFIANNPGAEYEPEKDNDNQTQQGNTSQPTQSKKVKIKWGEFFEFFWRLYDSKQLENFEGKFINPRTPKIEEVVEKASITIANKISIDISKAIDTRLNELNQTANQTSQAIQNSQNSMNNTLSHIMEEIRDRIQAIGNNMASRRRRRSPSW